jgi:sugar phosphate isomerase/epimerase
MWRRRPDNGTPAAWRDMLASVADAVAAAEAHGVTLAFEPEHANVVDSAAAGRRLRDELRSPRLNVVIDAANLLAGGGLDRQAEVLHEAFDLLGDDVVLAHAKDVRRDGTFVAAGRGDLDYELYAALLAQIRGGVPLILHGLAEDEVPGSVAFVETALTGAGAERRPGA